MNGPAFNERLEPLVKKLGWAKGGEVIRKTADLLDEAVSYLERFSFEFPTVLKHYSFRPAFSNLANFFPDIKILSPHGEEWCIPITLFSYSPAVYIEETGGQLRISIQEPIDGGPTDPLKTSVFSNYLASTAHASFDLDPATPLHFECSWMYCSWKSRDYAASYK